jgi:hypothetical protein
VPDDWLAGVGVTWTGVDVAACWEYVWLAEPVVDAGGDWTTVGALDAAKRCLASSRRRRRRLATSWACRIVAAAQRAATRVSCFSVSMVPRISGPNDARTGALGCGRPAERSCAAAGRRLPAPASARTSVTPATIRTPRAIPARTRHARARPGSDPETVACRERRPRLDEAASSG